MATRNGHKPDAQPGSILLVIHDFVARSGDELSLAKGDRIELIERDDDFGDGWFLGRHMGNGNSGLFPEVYTTPAPRGTLTGTAHQRRVSEGTPKSAGSDAASTSPTQLRHSSASAVSCRPGSANQASPLAQATLRGSLPLSSSVAASPSRTNTFNADSPVMNETLSVIDEHITDMHSPRSSYANGNKRDTVATIGSVYSQPISRLSYIPGHETDEDEQGFHTEEEVMAWTPARVAEYLEDHGVEKAHCDVFKEQEISGEVLLAMDQSSIFIKEFELGPVGRRLRTWHKIKALQEEVRGARQEVAKSTSEYSASVVAEDDASLGEMVRTRSSTIGTILPRGLEPTIRPVDGRTHTTHSLQPSISSQASSTYHLPSLSAQGAAAAMLRAPGGSISPLQNITSMSRPENTYRPSAQSIRDMQHARRHSSIDSTSSAGGGINRTGHKKQPSIDNKWQPGYAMTQAMNSTSSSGGHAHTSSTGGYTKRESSSIVARIPDDLDRGYFSSNEVDNRTSTGAKKSNVIMKKISSTTASPAHSRTNSSSFFSTSRQSGSIKEPVSPLNEEPGGTQYMLQSIVSLLEPEQKSMAEIKGTVSPVVTKLDQQGTPSSNSAVATDVEKASKDTKTSPISASLGFFGSQKQKISGLRALSDAITHKEKHSAGTESPASDAKMTPTTNEKGESVSSPTRTGSTTPSTETRSFELQKSMDGQSRTSTGSGSKLIPPTPAVQRRIRPKTKKSTSAYTRGLEKKTPAEQMEGCDYSGWMKKKSGSLMSTWKTRLFILRGRRLSYYYRDNDSEEKGLIDISFHRVLPAHNETLTGLHAAMTGAANNAAPQSPTSMSSAGFVTTAERDLKENPPKADGGDDSGLFIFKLVPPKPGHSRGVNFTKPTVHYFAVNSRQEGRLWMAALMKATIDRDEDGVVTTTYNQETISLAKARARKERPPALREEEMIGRSELDASSDISSTSRGLGIGGYVQRAADAVAGTDTEKEKVTESAQSIAPNIMSVGGNASRDGLDEKEREAIAMNTHA
ncbi:hypothetical protein M433DRAFT_71835 [Acidomyces richmondensis BFW]|nr:MAG: hypothetical protein FE78DRAFT_154502 [Acidomyces sp. 'richmondensis']KYG43362.1 hypothetical protein M433DRAFT_71835 [Acidomyces richmondensis BFW]